jgi:type I restriction enzyme, S subunit
VIWDQTTLADLFEICSSKRVLKAQWQTEGVPFFRGREITKLALWGYVENDLFISEALYRDFSRKYGAPTAGDIMITAIGTIGNSYIVRESDRFYFKDASVLWMRKNAEFDSRFINYWLRSDYMKEQLDKGNGATVDTLTIEKLKSLKLLLPALPEQQRIVAILDEAFEGVAKATANAERNLANARELFERALVQRLTEVPVERTASVRDLALDKRGAIRTGPFGSQLLHSEFVDDGSIAVLGIDNVVDNAFTWKRRRYITEKKYMGLQRYTVKSGDVLISIMGTCGRCAIVPDSIEPAINSKHLCCITLDKNKCLPEFLHTYFLFHPSARAYLAAQSKGSIMDGLNMGIIQEMPIDLPSVQNQKAIGRHAEILRDMSNGLGEIYEKKCSRLAELRRALLHKAFSGQLTGKEEVAA